MRSALWVAAAGMSAPTLLEAIPPACRRTVEPPSAVVNDGDVVLIESPVWPVAGATHFVPAFATHATLPLSTRLEVAVWVNGAWSPWVAGVTLGAAVFEAQPSVDALEVDIDVFRARMPADAARLRLRLQAPEPAAVVASPWMLTLSAAAGLPEAGNDASEPGVRLEVPARSQMEGEAAIASRICSPTCVAMLLDFWRRPARLDALAAEMFHPGADLYGIWPAAILAAGRRGLAGYILRFPDWAAARWCLARGLPIIASVRYAAGELTGAAAVHTPGHLLVLTGWDGEEVLVNDPAAPTAASVSRRYHRDEIVRVWLERSGVGYVIFPGY